MIGIEGGKEQLLNVKRIGIEGSKETRRIRIHPLYFPRKVENEVMSGFLSCQYLYQFIYNCNMT